MTESPRRRRRWFSLSLRGMMLLILVVGGLMGWKTRRASLQRRAVARIEYLRGTMSYDWQLTTPFGGVPPGGAGPKGPVWLRKLLGDEYFQDVVEVELESPGFMVFGGIPPSQDAPSDGPEWRAYREVVRQFREVKEARLKDQLACLEGLGGIESLGLSGLALNSDGLARLGRMTSLKKFKFVLTSMDAAGLTQIAKLSRLEKLDIQLELQDDAALAAQECLPRLQKLWISDASTAMNGFSGLVPEELVRHHGEIRNAWLARLARCGSLTTLSVDGAEITDDGLAHLKNLKKLVMLHLSKASKVTDAGLAELAKLENLTSLNLSAASKVTDTGLAELAKLENLTSLDLSAASKVTDTGVAELAKLENLTSLNLSAASKVTDATVVTLAKMPRLFKLRLNAKSLTDAGLKRLGSLNNLNALTLTGAEIKGEILDSIQAANPALLDQGDPGRRRSASRGRNAGSLAGRRSGAPRSRPARLTRVLEAEAWSVGGTSRFPKNREP